MAADLRIFIRKIQYLFGGNCQIGRFGRAGRVSIIFATMRAPSPQLSRAPME
jgi:hypothetical protein